ncbi:MAG: hypothetical protein D6780_03340, partial [Candidatus Dadabacteria bacterium]
MIRQYLLSFIIPFKGGFLKLKETLSSLEEVLETIDGEVIVATPSCYYSYFKDKRDLKVVVIDSFSLADLVRAGLAGACGKFLSVVAPGDRFLIESFDVVKEELRVLGAREVLSSEVIKLNEDGKPEEIIKGVEQFSPLMIVRFWALNYTCSQFIWRKSDIEKIFSIKPSLENEFYPFLLEAVKRDFKFKPLDVPAIYTREILSKQDLAKKFAININSWFEVINPVYESYDCAHKTAICREFCKFMFSASFMLKPERKDLAVGLAFAAQDYGILDEKMLEELLEAHLNSADILGKGAELLTKFGEKEDEKGEIMFEEAIKLSSRAEVGIERLNGAVCRDDIVDEGELAIGGPSLWKQNLLVGIIIDSSKEEAFLASAFIEKIAEVVDINRFVIIAAGKAIDFYKGSPLASRVYP